MKKVFIVTRHGVGHDNHELLMAFNNLEAAEKFHSVVSDYRTLCLNGDKPKPNQYMWSDRFRITEVSLH